MTFYATHMIAVEEIPFTKLCSLKTIESLLENADPPNPNRRVHKMSDFGVDGASINMGATGRIGAHFRGDVGEPVLSSICLSHHLELTMLST